MNRHGYPPCELRQSSAVQPEVFADSVSRGKIAESVAMRIAV
jgi:hypothetical protein